jgi:hypothetical protein
MYLCTVGLSIPVSSTRVLFFQSPSARDGTFTTPLLPVEFYFGYNGVPVVQLPVVGHRISLLVLEYSEKVKGFYSTGLPWIVVVCTSNLRRKAVLGNDLRQA